MADNLVTQKKRHQDSSEISPEINIQGEDYEEAISHFSNNGHVLFCDRQYCARKKGSPGHNKSPPADHTAESHRPDIKSG